MDSFEFQISDSESDVETRLAASVKASPAPKKSQKGKETTSRASTRSGRRASPAKKTAKKPTTKRKSTLPSKTKSPAKATELSRMSDVSFVSDSDESDKETSPEVAPSPGFEKILEDSVVVPPTQRKLQSKRSRNSMSQVTSDKLSLSSIAEDSFRPDFSSDDEEEEEEDAHVPVFSPELSMAAESTPADRSRSVSSAASMSAAGSSDIICNVCHKDENDEDLLLCESCPNATHLWCCDPPFSAVPKGEWFCAECVQAKKRTTKRGAAKKRTVDDVKEEDLNGSQESNSSEISPSTQAFDQLALNTMSSLRPTKRKRLNASPRKKHVVGSESPLDEAQQAENTRIVKIFAQIDEADLEDFFEVA